MKYRLWIWLVLGALPVPVYPFVLVANLMMFDAGDIRPISLSVRLTTLAFFFTCGAYPIVYIACAVVAVLHRQSHPKLAVNFAVLPLLHLAIIAALFLGLFIVSS